MREITNASGGVVASYDYDPYGRMTWNSGTKVPAFGNAGYFYHAASGMNLTIYRAYDPRLGRWLSLDPIGERGGDNLYAYVGNDPGSRMDSLGLWAIQVGGSFGALFPAMGGAGESGIAFSYSAENGFQVAGFQSAQFRGGVGLYAGPSLNFTFTPSARCVAEVGGASLGVGVDVPIGGGSVQASNIGGDPLWSGTVGIGPCLLGDVYGSVTYTHVGTPLTLFGGDN